MKQNITLALDKHLLKRARSFAAQRRTSISAMLAGELRKLMEREAEYGRAKSRAVAQLNAPYHLGGSRIADRETLHDRQGLR